MIVYEFEKAKDVNVFWPNKPSDWFDIVTRVPAGAVSITEYATPYQFADQSDYANQQAIKAYAEYQKATNAYKKECPTCKEVTEPLSKPERATCYIGSDWKRSGATSAASAISD